MGASYEAIRNMPEDPVEEVFRDAPNTPLTEVQRDFLPSVDEPSIMPENTDVFEDSVANKYVIVSTAQELADAIAPGRCITLKEGVYDLSTVTETASPYVEAGSDLGYYGYMRKAALLVSGVEGLTLQAAPGAKVEIVTPDMHSEVLMFRQCVDITVSGIEAGHTVTGEYECDAGVVFLEQSADITIIDCLFYGCGSVGIWLRDCDFVQVVDTTVTDCSLRAVDLSNSYDITFAGCRFVDNRAYGGIIYGSSSTAVFSHCEISGNKLLSWSLVEFNMEHVDGVLFEHCMIRDNSLTEESAQEQSKGWDKWLFKGQGISLRDCEIEKSNFSDYWGSGVVDLGGNTLTF